MCLASPVLLMIEKILAAYHKSLAEFCTYPALRLYAKSLKSPCEISVLAIGKAAWQMANVFCQELRDQHIAYSGYVLTKYYHSPQEIPFIQIREAGHPLPDENSLLFTDEILHWLQGCDEDSELCVLLSGGASALFEKLPPQISLQHFRRDSQEFLASGKDIAVINHWRIGNSCVKGGKALRWIKSNKVQIFALSDVRGNPPDIIGSGAFSRGENLANYQIVGDNLSFRNLFIQKLLAECCVVMQDESHRAEAAQSFATHIQSYLQKHAYSEHEQKKIMLWGGECPVEVHGEGKGGRCTHLCLLLSKLLAGRKGMGFAAIASDGSDGPTDAAGAWINGDTYFELVEAGIDVDMAIKKCDSYRALDKVNKLIRTAATGTNVNDLFVLWH